AIARQAAAEMNATISVLQGIDQVANQFEDVLRALEKRTSLIFDDLEALLCQAGTNYQRYSQAQRQYFWASFEFARALRQVIDLPLFASSEGSTSENSPALLAG